MTTRPFQYIQPASLLRKILWSIRAVPLSERFESGSVSHLAVIVIMTVALGVGQIRAEHRAFVGVTMVLATVTWVAVQSLHSYLAWRSAMYRIRYRVPLALARIGEQNMVVALVVQAMSDAMAHAGQIRTLNLESLSESDRLVYEQAQAEDRANVAAMMEIP